MSADSPKPRRFAVAFSFPGPHRAYVERVARALLPAFGGGDQGKARIFYDAWHEGKVIGYGSNRKLQTIYATDSDLIVPFYCQDYLGKKWCGVELRAIEELLFDQQFERVLPFRFDMVDIPGSFKTDVFPIVTDRPPEDIARLIVERYHELSGTMLEPPASDGGKPPVEVRQPKRTSRRPGKLAAGGESQSSSSDRKPRVYLSYTWRTKGMKARAFKLAERLFKVGIDVRIDFFYAKSLHGFTPPDPLPDRDSWDAWQEEQVREADFVLVICTPEYVASPPTTGAGRDMKYMQDDLKSGRAGMRKFIPVGFDSYGAIEPLIPPFMRGANYYDLTANGLEGFGFADLVRRLKTELANGTAVARPKVAAARPTSTPASVTANPALALWQKKLDFLQVEEARAADAEQKFSIQQRIEEARAKIKELGG